MRSKKNYDFALIYANCCVNCAKEGTYHCTLEVEKGRCLNFDDNPNQSFGGY